MVKKRIPQNKVAAWNPSGLSCLWYGKDWTTTPVSLCLFIHLCVYLFYWPFVHLSNCQVLSISHSSYQLFIHPINFSFILSTFHSSYQLFICMLIYYLNCSIILSFLHTFACSFTLWIIHSSVHSSNQLSIHLFIHPIKLPFIFAFFLTSLHPFNFSFIYPIKISLICPIKTSFIYPIKISCQSVSHSSSLVCLFIC